MKKRLLSFVWLLAVIVSTFWAFGSLSSANASDVLKLGDVDGNGTVNVADITVLINYLKTPSTKIVAAAADANHDGKINASDEAAIANIIMSGTPDQSANSILFFTEATVESAFGSSVTNTLVRAGSTGAITYSASPASVATVNATTGEVTCVGAGQATVTATLAASGKYKGTTAQFTLKVVKSTSTDPDDAMTTEPEAKTAGSGGGNQSCTGEPLPLITEGESAGGTIHYKVTTTDTPPSKSDPGWTTEIPTATDAGTYYVWYYTDGNENCVESDVCSTPVVVTIDKAPSTTDPADTMTTEPEAKTSGSGDGNPTYTGGAQPLITPGESSAGTVHYKVTTTNTPPSKSDPGWTTEVPTATDPGTYYVWYYADGNDNYEETAICGTPITVTIDKAPATTDPAETMTKPIAAKTTEGGGDQPYTGSAQPLITAGESAAGTVYYKVTPTNTKPSKSDPGWTTEVPTATDAGTYYVWYYAKGNDKYEETAICDTPITVTIAKTAATTDPATTMTTPVAASKTEGGANPAYTGSAQPLITAGESKAGTVKYMVTTTNTQPSKTDAGWSTTVPTATDAGTYYVWYYAEGNDNYSETAVSATPVTVTIEKAAGTTDPATTMTTAPAASKTEGGGNPAYTGSAQPLITGGESVAGTVRYKVTTTNVAPAKDNTWTTEVPTATNAGTYYVWYYAEGNDNYSETTVCGTPITATIEKAAATTDPATTMTTAPAANNPEGGLIYTGNPLDLITAGASKAGTLRYKATTTNEPPIKDNTWTTGVPKGTVAGTYYVWYYAEGNDNYSETTVCGTPITVTIENAQMEGVTVQAFTGSYDGQPHGITLTVPDGATVKYREAAEGEYTLTENPTYTDVAAEARVVYYQITRPSFEPAYGSAMVTINKVVLTATADDKTRDYGTANPELTVSVTGFVNNETAATAAGYTAPAAATEATVTSAAGNYDITVSGGAATNYMFSYTKGTLTINKVNATATAPTAVQSSLTYNSNPQTLFTNGSTGDGTLMYEVTTTDAKPTSTADFKTTIDQGTAAGTYYLWYYVKGDASHNDTGVNDTPVSKAIGKKAPAASDFTYAPPASLIYSGSAKAATFTVNEGTLGMGNISSVKYYKDNQEAMPTAVGTYTVKITVAEGDNYSAMTAELTDDTWTFTITAATAGLTAPTAVDGNLTYDGTEKALFNKGVTSDGTLMYKVTTTNEQPTTASSFKEAIDTPTNAGTYYLWYYVKGDANHSDTGINAIPITKVIRKKAPVASEFTYTAPESPIVYDGTVKTATVVANEGISGMGAVTVKYFKNNVQTNPVEGGIYTVKISVAEGTNYSATTADADLTAPNWTFTIDKVVQSATSVTGFTEGGGDSNGTVTF